MTSSDADFQLLNDARAWAAQDPDPVTATTLTELVKLTEAGTPSARQELADSFNGTQDFGTAGLPASLAPAPNLMNRLVDRRAWSTNSPTTANGPTSCCFAAHSRTAIPASTTAGPRGDASR